MSTALSLNASEESIQLLTFKIDKHLFGVHVLNVRDIFVADKVTPVPLANPEIKGLINLRGRIVTSISLRKKLGFPDLGEELKQMNIAVEHEGEVYSLLVDKVGDVMNLAQDTFEKKPQVLDPAVKEYAQGVFKLDNDLLIFLDIHKIVETCI